MSKVFNILVTPKEASNLIGRMPPALLKNLNIEATHGRVFDKKRLIGLLRDKDGVILDLETIDRDVLSACPRLKVISRYGEGYDTIDIKEAKRRGVRVTRARGVASKAVARHAFALILALTHNVASNDKALKKGIWEKRPNLSDGSLVLGILGFGFIGKRLADMAAGYGFKVIAYDERREACKGYERTKSAKELIRRSDVISLHLPLSAKTRGIISRRILRDIKGKYIVNTSRGGLVDEEAILRALDLGAVAGYATDVFSNEPIRGISLKIARHPKVVCSPHVASYDEDTAFEMTKRALENALNCLNKKHEKVVAYVV